MSYINATTAVNRVKLVIVKQSAIADQTNLVPVESDFYSAASNSTGAITTHANDSIVVPGLQDITINNSNGSYRWKQLDQAGENVITTNASNSISGNFVLDPSTFWGAGSGGGAGQDGIFKLSNNRTAVAFLIAPSGVTDGNTVLMGTGYISALAPKVSADSPVWVSPITVEVNGDYTKGTTSIAT